MSKYYTDPGERLKAFLRTTKRQYLRYYQEHKKEHATAGLKRRYKLTSEQYTRMLVTQGDACKICGLTGIRLEVDHNHKTGRVRGLLCHKCNMKLVGLDDPIWLEKALTYLNWRW
jgi:hypothetical protein